MDGGIRKRGLALVVAASMGLSACVPGGANLNLGSTTEECYPQRAALASEKDYFAQDVVETMLKGAVVGAIAGGLLAAATGRSVVGGILVGAGTAALAGAAAGYWNALQKQNENASSLDILSTVRNDVERENTRIASFRGKFNQLIRCRQGQVERTKADYKAGRLTAEQAKAELAKLKTLYDEDIELAKQINGRMDERSKDLMFANAQINPDSEAHRIRVTRTDLVATSGVNVRAGASTSTAKVSSLTSGQKVTGLARKGDWWQIDLGGKRTGWVAARFLKAAPGAGSVPEAGPVVDVPSNAKPAVKIQTAEERREAEKVDEVALTNVEVRRDSAQDLAAAESWNGFEGGLDTVGSLFEQGRIVI